MYAFMCVCKCVYAPSPSLSHPKASQSCFITDYSPDDYKTNISFVQPSSLKIFCALHGLYISDFKITRREDYIVK